MPGTPHLDFEMWETIKLTPLAPLAPLRRNHDRRSRQVHHRTDRSPRTRSRHRAQATRRLGPDLAGEDDLRNALEKAFEYRGDVSITTKSGQRIEAYVFNRHTAATLADSYVQYFAANHPAKQKLSYTDIARLEFTGKDRAAGKHWEDWVKAYNERKAAGEKNIALHPESLE